MEQGPGRQRPGRRSSGREQRPGRRALSVRTAVRLLPALLLAAGILFDYLTPREFSATPLLTAAPLAAAPLYSRRGTVLTGLAAVLAALAVLAGHAERRIVVAVGAFTELVTVTTVAVLAVLINAIVTRGHEQLASAREIAEAAQLAVLPEPEERIGGLEVAARYEAAQAGASIGGDLYAVQDSPYGVRLIVGDVRGKGMGAVAVVAVLVGTFREAAEQEATLGAVAQRLERALVRESGARREADDAFEEFTTAVIAEIPHGETLVRVVNRGHPPPLLLLSDGTVRALPGGSAALPLGLGELSARPDRTEETDFPPGATLLLYTDGLSEARDAHGVFYDPEARLRGHTFPGGPQTLLTALATDVRRHAAGGGLTDDMALLAVRRP